MYSLADNCTLLQLSSLIRKSVDQRLFAPSHSLSQLVTSFFASESLGIHHTPLFTFLSNQILLTFFYAFQYVKELYELAPLPLRGISPEGELTYGS